MKNSDFAFALGLVGRNVAFQLLSRFFELGSILVLTIVIGRYLGPAELGRFSYVHTVALLSGFLVDFGLTNLLIIEIAKQRQKVAHLISTAIHLTVLLIIFSLFLSLFVIYQFGTLDETGLALLYAISWIGLGAVGGVLRGGFYGIERMAFETAAVTVERVLLIGFSIVCILEFYSIANLILAMLLSRILGLIFATSLFIKFVGNISKQMNFGMMKWLLVSAIPFALNPIASFIYLRGDIILLSHFRDELELGLYQAAANLVSPWITLAVSLNIALLPTMTKLYARGQIDESNRIITESLKYLLLLSVPLALGLFLNADRVVVSIFGMEFSNAVFALQIISPIIPLRFANNALATALTASNQQTLRTKLIGVAAVLNITLNVMVLPILGMVGACLTTVATEIFIFLSLHIVHRRALSIKLYYTICRPIAAGCVGIVIVFFLLRETHVMVTGLVQTITYFTIISVLGESKLAQVFSRLRG